MGILNLEELASKLDSSRVTIGNIRKRNENSHRKFERNSSRKWCSFHKFTSHSNEECFSQKKTRQNKDSNLFSSTHLNLSATVVSRINDDKTLHLVAVDTGASDVFINPKYLNSIKTETLEIPKKVKFGKNKYLFSYEFSFIRMNSPEADENTYLEITAYVLKEQPCPILIGDSFPKGQKAKVDYECELIKINDLEIPFYKSERTPELKQLNEPQKRKNRYFSAKRRTEYNATKRTRHANPA